MIARGEQGDPAAWSDAVALPALAKLLWKNQEAVRIAVKQDWALCNLKLALRGVAARIGSDNALNAALDAAGIPAALFAALTADAKIDTAETSAKRP